MVSVVEGFILFYFYWAVPITPVSAPTELTTLPYNENRDYIDDLDNFTQTDEYQNNMLLKYYFDGQKHLLRLSKLFKRMKP
jgi:hypothetical protein